MYQAVGKNTKKVYSRGKYRQDCLRKLHHKYPYSKNVREKRTVSTLYPEPLLIVRNSN